MRKILTLVLAIALTATLTTVIFAETETELTILDVEDPDVQVVSFRDTDSLYKQATFSLQGDGSAEGAIVAESKDPSGKHAPDVNKVVKVEGGFLGKNGDLESTFSSYGKDKGGSRQREIFNSNTIDVKGATDDSLIVFGNAHVWESATPGPHGSIKQSGVSQRFTGEVEKATIESNRSSDDYASFEIPPSANLSVEISNENDEDSVDFTGGSISGRTGVFGGSEGLKYDISSSEGNIEAKPTTSYSYTRTSQDTDWVWGSTSGDEGSQLEIPDFSDYEVPGFNFEPIEE